MGYGLFAYGLIVILIGIVVIFFVSRLKYIWMEPSYAYTHNLYTYPFKTGDLILTCDRISGGTIIHPAVPVKVGTASTYNHTGVVYVDPFTKQVFVWEMNGRGSRLASLYDLTCGKLDHYIAVRPLNKPVDNKLFEEILRKQWNYEFNFDIGVSWYNRYVPLIPFVKGHQWGKGKKQRTCAHMTVEMYDSLGVIDLRGSGVDPSSVFAGDFGHETIDTKILPLTNGYQFGPIINLQFKATPKNRFQIRDQQNNSLEN